MRLINETASTHPLTPAEMALAPCRQVDPEVFFEITGPGDWRARAIQERWAKAICAGCEIRTRCLKVALANDERFGIFGGLNARERAALGRRAAS